MDEVLRKTGIDVLGDVPWGTHFCQFYRTSQDLLDTLVPYFRAGLGSNEFCMWVTSEPLGADEATQALRRAVPDLDTRLANGQIEIIPYTDWYVVGGSFDQERVLNGWVEKLNDALARGYDGLRLSGNTFWLEKDDWQGFTDYEEAVNSVIGNYRMLALCTYSVDRCGASEIADVVKNHEFALMKRDSQWSIIESAEYRQTKEALRRSEQRYRGLFEGMTEGFALHEIICDPSGVPCDYRFLEANPGFERLTGLAADQVLGKTVRETMPGTEQYWIDAFGKVALTGEPTRFENYSHVLDRHYEVYAYRPAPMQFAVLFMDITERKQAEEERRLQAERLADMNEELQAQGEELTATNEELQTANESLREASDIAERRAAELQSFVSSMPDGVGLIDASGNVVWMNEAGRRILGASESDSFERWQSRWQHLTLDGRPMQRSQTVIRRALKGLTIIDARHKLVTPTGYEIILSASASPVRDSGGNVIGATYVFRDARDRFELEQMRARRYEREHHIAEMLQNALVPETIDCRVPGCYMAVRYRAALNEAEVGGDFYDVFELDGGRVGILIGDVAGKGLGAAVRVAAARHAVRSYALLDPSPAKVLSLANDALTRGQTDADGLMTVFFAVLDLDTQTLRYANGGHVPPIVMSASGEFEELAEEGFPLGILEDREYSESSRKMQPDDLVVMVTDGITEARRTPTDLFGTDGIVRFLSANPATADLERTATGLLDAALDHAGGKIQDDVAIIIFRMAANASRPCCLPA